MKRFCCGLATVSTATLILWTFSYHRFRLADLPVMLEVSRLPEHSRRCKAVNTSHFRCLANVFFIGASKSGTTSFLDYLLQNPDVDYVRRFVVTRDTHKEIHRFDRSSYPWANKHLELLEEWASSPIVKSEHDSVIHYTPHYLYAPTVPYELREDYPEIQRAKFLVVLRNPVERAVSSYWFRNSHLLKGRDRGSWNEFFSEIKRQILSRKSYEACLERLTRDGALDDTFGNLRTLQTCFGSSLRSSSLGVRDVDKGIYYDQLLRWFANFNRSQFVILFLEQFSQRPCEVYRDTLSRLSTRAAEEVAAFPCPNFSRKRLVSPNSLANASDPASQQAKAEAIAALREFYRPYNLKLKRLLGMEITYD